MWDSIPNTPSENCLLKIIDDNDPNIWDQSDSTFSIVFAPQITVVSPNGGESVERGHAFTITWNFQQINKFNILYSLDGGENRENIITNLNLSGNNREFLWNVPDTTSEQCLVKIESSLNPACFDISDQIFKIIDLPSFSYFPMNVGNIWYFSEGFDGEIKYRVEVQKDTILDDNYSYAKFNRFYIPDDSLLYVFYLRKENNQIILYSNNIILNFDMSVGDTVTTVYEFPYSAVLNNLNLVNVFGRYLTTYFFNMGPYQIYSYTDSIGFNTWSADTWTNYYPQYLLGCVIDGVSYGLVRTQEETKNIPNAFNLSQNYPNPFNPSTTIRYSVPGLKPITLKVYDVLGNEIKTLVKSEKPSGTYEVKWNATGVPSGIYFYQIKAGDYIQTRKMVLLK